ncbi:hypothetical protein AAY42_15380 [Flagellimonas eckloniae]|uniref:Uncharacterized protein n=1 Tax=Flagellimonas eckloniae TaxID=346185 RepID=A0A0Q1C1M0_9FLAO|nr:hypothetical protein AAY42_15380 [Allomuricauda eckloniae]
MFNQRQDSLKIGRGALKFIGGALVFTDSCYGTDCTLGKIYDFDQRTIVQNNDFSDKGMVLVLGKYFFIQL